ncbi:MAG TPA: ABC transporter permease [Vicinamibacterales bacterium]|nr:ABC transporter permease [Vicinamibacterales bacterium]
MSGSRSWTERALRRLVRMLPAQFRFDFRAAIEADLDERRRAGDEAGLLRREVPSLAGAVVREHSSAFVSDLQQDVKYAFRMMRRTPGFTAMAVLMLALGTGVNAALFSVIDAVMLRSPFSHPERIARLQTVNDKRAVPTTLERFDALANAPGPFQSVSAFTGGTHIFLATEEPRRLDVECVSAAMFDILGTPPLLRRPFSAAEDQPNAPATMVVSFDFWQTLGGTPSVVGSTVTVNQTPVTVLGVMPRGFSGALSRSDVAAWLPFRRPVVGGGATGCASPRGINVFARVRDGVTLDAARTAFADIRVLPIEEQTYGDLRAPFLVLGAAVAFVLLIACFNVAGLQMERALARRREIAVRLALGAGRWRLIRQALTENVILALAGAAAGLAATGVTMRALISLLPANLPHLDQIALNARVLVFTLIAASAAGIVAGLLPIGQMRRVDPGKDLTTGLRSGARHTTWTRRGLVIVEIALSVVVLIGAVLMIRSFHTLRPTNPGFDPRGKMTLLVRLPGASTDTTARFFADLFELLRSAPGVRGLAGSTYQPMRGSMAQVPTSFAGTSEEINTIAITPEYFDLLKIPVRSGRGFEASDTSGSEPVAVVNELFARRIRPDGQVLGELVGVTALTRLRQPPVERRIVGIVGNTRAVGSQTRPWNEVYVPYAQDPAPAVFVFAEAAGGNEAAVAVTLRKAVRSLRPDLPVEDVELLPNALDRSVRWWRFGAWLLGIFAALAVMLAAIGLMTTIGWWVNQRTRELGVRIALGASRANVTRFVFRQGLTLGATGIAAGCLVAAGATKFLEGWIYGIAPRDLPTFAGCALGMLVIAALAVYFPVRRATSVDPVVALRAD